MKMIKLASATIEKPSEIKGQMVDQSMSHESKF